MEYTKENYKEFLETEYESLMNSYTRLITTKAIVLKERGDVFVARFLKINSNIAIFKVRISDNMPRKNSFWTASVFSGEMGSFRNWGNLSWADLREHHQSTFSNSYCAWLSKSDDPQFCLIGIKGITIPFAKRLENNKTVVAFGPNTPPTKYLLNLLDLCNEKCARTDSLLEYDKNEHSVWNPQDITSAQNLNDIIIKKLSSTDCIAIQGPPGTGKTFRMAQLAAFLLNERKSILVTALTNRALMELASKADLTNFLNEGRISKTSLTIDEHKELPKLLSNDDNQCNAAPGHLSLATFYISSGWAKDSSEEFPFDYVIMDEASQALFPMIAAIKKLAKKVIWIGDQAQLAPILSMNEDIIEDKGWYNIVHGFGTLCNNFKMPSFMLSDTFRLTERGAQQTGIFYNGKLKSVSSIQKIETRLPELNTAGGSSFIGLEMRRGDKAPLDALNKIFDLTKRILTENPKAEIAILSKFIDTTKALQKYFVMNLQTEDIPKNIIIETVDKVQGLTVDYTLFFIPKVSIDYSVEKELFNVATSRARNCTILVSDKNLLRENMPQEVRKYLLKIEENKVVTLNAEFFPIHDFNSTNIRVKSPEKIHLHEKKYREIEEGKDNIYIIDTNVFVSCPSIISKIKTYKIIIPTTVLEELDHLKIKPNIDKRVLSDVAKNINIAFQKQYSHLEAGDPNLLPIGFDSKKADSLILSVALKYKREEKNPILLTSDQLLQSKALGLGITTISLSEFFNERRI